jgi:hypothetical protein
MHGTAMRITIGRACRGIGSLLPGQIYVGRPSPLGNPYLLGRDGNREEVIAQYRRWYWAQLQSPGSPQERELRRLLAQAQSGELELLCWCAPLPCRAEVVRSALLWLAVEERAGAPAALLAQAAGIGWPVRSTHLNSAGSLGL